MPMHASGASLMRDRSFDEGWVPLDQCFRKRVVSLQQLDAFLAYARSQPQMAERLKAPMDLAELLGWAAECQFQVEEADVIAAMVREDEQLSDAELQHRAGEEARKLRNFIPG